MSVRTKAIWVVGASPVAFVPGAALLLRLVPAQPRPAIQTAQSFVACLQAHEPERAYRLTTQQSEVGTSLGEFQGIVRQQWPGKAPNAVQLVAVRPFQSYRNRLRRWFRGQAMDPAEQWLGFSVGGLPFEVRETHADGAGWKVDHFQSHAG